MSTKKKIKLEFEINSAPTILFAYLTEPNALSQWFADEVELRDHVYTFHWEQESARARIVSEKENKLVRYKWLDDPENTYTEFEIVQDELTNDVALAVTEFTADDPSEHKLIWNNNMRFLASVLGA